MSISTSFSLLDSSISTAKLQLSSISSAHVQPSIEVSSGKNASSGYAGLNAAGLLSSTIFNHVASDNIKISHDASQQTAWDTWNVYTVVKKITINEPLAGAARVKFSISCSQNTGYAAYGKVYKNGVAIGAETTASSNAVVNSSEDFTLNLSAGDTLEIWAYSSGQVNYAVITNFRICYDNTPPASAVSSTNTI